MQLNLVAETFISNIDIKQISLNIRKNIEYVHFLTRKLLTVFHYS